MLRTKKRTNNKLGLERRTLCAVSEADLVYVVGGMLAAGVMLAIDPVPLTDPSTCGVTGCVGCSGCRTSNP